MANLNDLLQRLCDADIDKLRTVLADLQPVHRMTPQRLSFLETDAGAVDFLTAITGVGDFSRIRTQSVEVELFGRRCRVMSLPDLIAAKLALGRDKDLLAARELQAIAERLGKR